ncbi:PGAP1-like protein [Actinoplanes cyaneus]|nr:PGAP1-like protein [Actinoplanes cyaneus]
MHAGTRSHDVVVVVPGIMGSELIDSVDKRVLWGLRDAQWYVRAWTTGSGLTDLRLTDDERVGRYGRVTATGALRFPAFARILAGFEPYTDLIATTRAGVVPAAPVIDFGYDWRLPVAHNAGLLADRIDRELRRWRADPAHDDARRRHPDGRPAQVVIVAHSMGGLLARYLCTIPGAADDVRAVVTLGTPFFGSVKATAMLNVGRGTRILPARRSWRATFRRTGDDGLRALAAGLPGVHELLPFYRCVDDGVRGQRLSEDVAVGLGADRDLFRAATALHERLRDVTLPGHRPIVGTEQPTAQSLTVRDGVVETSNGLWVDAGDGTASWSDEAGDGTVYRGAASLGGATHVYLPQQHGRLARSDEGRAMVRGVLTERDPALLGPPQAGPGLGLTLPDVVTAGEAFSAYAVGADGYQGVRCRVTEADSGRTVAVPDVARGDGEARIEVTLPRPGLYRLEVGGSGYSGVSQLVLAADASDDDG